MRDIPSSTLARLWRAYRLELRLLCRHWAYFLLHLLWAILIFGSSPGGPAFTAQGMLETTGIFATRALISLFALFIAGNSVTRNVRARFDALENALPTGFETHLGRWLACTTAIIAFGIEPLIAAFALGPAESFAVAAIPFVLKATVLLSFSTAVTWLLVGLLGPRRWVYPLLVAGWMGLLVLPTLLLDLRLPFAGLINFSGNGSPIVYSEVFGVSIQGDLPIWFHLFYLAALFVLIGIVALRYSAKRFYRFSVRTAGLTIIALIIAVIFAHGYSSTVAAARMRTEFNREVYYDNIDSSIYTVDAPESVRAYNITIDLTDLTTPRFTASLDVRNRDTAALQSLNFTLHRDLQITKSNIPYKRDGDFITLMPSEPLQPDEALSWQLTYAGTIWHTETFGGIPLASDFINADGVSLSFNLAWYPLAGRFVADGFMSSQLLMGEAARFKLNVIGADNMTFASNLPASGDRTFSADAAAWAMLIGSPRLIRVDLGPINLIAPRHDVDALQPLVHKMFAASLDQIRRFFPETRVKGLHIFSIDSFLSELVITMPADGWIVWPSSPSFVVALYNDRENVERWANAIVSPLLEALWPGDNPPGFQALREGGTRTYNTDHATLLNGIALFLESHRRTHGDAQAIERLLDDLNQATDESTHHVAPGAQSTLDWNDMDIAHALRDAYAEDGHDAVIRVLHQMTLRESEVLGLHADQLGAWIKAIADE